MAVELRMPSFGESVTEALVSRWLKQEGDWVETDEPVVVLETDKVTSEVPSPTRGRLERIVKAEGQTVVVGEVIAVIDETARPAIAEQPARTAPAAVAPPPAAPPPTPVLAPPSIVPVVQAAAPVVAAPAAPAKASSEAMLAPATPAATAVVPALPREAGRFAPSIARQEEVVPMSPLRKTIAERLVQAQRTAALLTTFNEVDMSAVIELRGRARPLFEEKYGVKLGFMSFFVKAAIDALKLVPQVNARVDGEAVVYRNYYDIAVAVGGGRGLVTPVLRNADQLSFAEVEIAIADFARRAKDNRLTLDELQGGTFTISNGGVYGSMLSTPIVNHPQSGILGLHTIQDRPVAREGQVVIRPMMYVALTYDHRIIDGREAVTFLRRVKDCIEDPSRILLEV